MAPLFSQTELEALGACERDPEAEMAGVTSWSPKRYPSSRSGSNILNTWSCGSIFHRLPGLHCYSFWQHLYTVCEPLATHLPHLFLEKLRSGEGSSGAGIRLCNIIHPGLYHPGFVSTVLETIVVGAQSGSVRY